jgi:hypothetical protein
MSTYAPLVGLIVASLDVVSPDATEGSGAAAATDAASERSPLVCERILSTRSAFFNPLCPSIPRSAAI